MTNARVLQCKKSKCVSVSWHRVTCKCCRPNNRNNIPLHYACRFAAPLTNNVRTNCKRKNPQKHCSRYFTFTKVTTKCHCVMTVSLAAAAKTVSQKVTASWHGLTVAMTASNDCQRPRIIIDRGVRSPNFRGPMQLMLNHNGIIGMFL